jgi:hypothetical protein
MFNHIKKFVLFVVALHFVGCANVSPMAINKSTKEINTSEKSIVLFTVNLARNEPSRYIPRPSFVRFEIKNAAGKNEFVSFQTDNEAGTYGSELSNTFYVRTALAPGEYVLHTILGSTSAFPFNGFFVMPVLIKVNVPNHKVAYLGRIDALLRPRANEEFRAGSVIPLIDQSVTGVSGNTFEISIKDNYQEDMPEFKKRFPVLENTEVQPIILNAWSRAVAEAWWHNDSK